MRTYPIIKLALESETIIFMDTDIIESRTVQEIHPISVELPASEMTVRVRTLDPRFNPFSSGEFFNELSQNIIVDVYEHYEYDDQIIVPADLFIGRFYLKEWRNPRESEFEFVCQDAIGVLDTVQFDGMFWATDVTIAVAISTILDPTGILYSVYKSIADRTIKGYLPPSTVREALQQVLFAARAYATTSEQDKRIIIFGAELPSSGINNPAGGYGTLEYGVSFYGDVVYDGAITNADKIDKQTLNLLPMVTEIQLVSHDFTESGVEEEIYSAYLEPGDYKVVYNKPYYGVSAEGVGATPAYLMTEDRANALTTEDGKILSFAGSFEFGVNHIYLHVTTAGNVVVRGYAYTDSTRVFSYVESYTSIVASNVWKVDKAYLITASAAPEVLEILKSYARLRYEQEITLFPTSAVKLGNIELVDTLYEKQINGVVTRMVDDLSGGHLIETTLVGVERIV